MMQDHKDYYIFPAIFTPDSGGFSVEFPDLPGCFTCGDDEKDAIYMAKDALPLHLYNLEEDDGAPIPEPSNVSELHLKDNQFVVMIEAWMVPFRDKITNKTVKKTLTIPKWLDDLAEKENVNFSHILQDVIFPRFARHSVKR